jgi:hypothetical protein
VLSFPASLFLARPVLKVIHRNLVLKAIGGCSLLAVLALAALSMMPRRCVLVGLGLTAFSALMSFAATFSFCYGLSDMLDSPEKNQGDSSFRLGAGFYLQNLVGVCSLWYALVQLG